MGIYNDGIIYGVYCFDIADDESYHLTILIDKKYDSKMTIEQIEEIKVEYEKIPEEVKKEMRVQFYTMVTISYEVNNIYIPHMMTWPGTREMLEEFLLHGDVRL